MTRPTRTFTDLDMNFLASPSTGDVTKRHDENAIKQAVKNLVLTNHYERLFHPEIGSSIQALLFDLDSPMLRATLERAITYTIENFEPRVRLIGVEVSPDPDNNRVSAQIEFTIVNTTRPIIVDVMLKRTR